ncbi:MAG TPA: hypothetical protein VKQ27_02480, partial [Acetobacteraceae bacterium]|nr:hypothetical protein [Acetobacteraceae bacterium]
QGHAVTVYMLAQKVPSGVAVRTGISDGRFTEVLAGSVKVGDPLVIGTMDAVASPSQSTLRTRLF